MIKLQKLEEKRQRNLQEREEALFEQIRKEAHLSSKEAEKLMTKHLEDLKESNGLSPFYHSNCDNLYVK